MTSMKLGYKAIWTKVGEFIGIPTLTDADDIAKCKAIVLRGYRAFLMPTDLSKRPPEIYRWTFLRKTTTLSVVAGTDEYKMPVGFSELVIPFTHTTPLAFNPVAKPLEFIYWQKSVATGTGYPVYYAIKLGDYDPINGQVDRVLFYPMPSANFDYYYTYLITPQAPVNDNDQFVGDDYASECILECSLVVAELQEKDTIGVHSQMADKLVQCAIGEDKRNYLVTDLGMITDGKKLDFVRTATIYQQGTWSNGIYTPGIQQLPQS